MKIKKNFTGLMIAMIALSGGIALTACNTIVNSSSTTTTTTTTSSGDTSTAHVHNWDDGTVTTEATYYSTGIKTYTCLDDSTHTRTEVIPMRLATVNDFLSVQEDIETATQFEYDYNLNLTTKISLVNGPSANIEGNVKFNSTGENKYLKIDHNTGALISDGTVYQTLQGTSLETFRVDEDNELYDHDQEFVSSDFQYESSSFAKLLFTDDAEDVSKLERVTGNNLKYEVSLPTNAGVISSALTVLNIPFIKQFLHLPDSDGNVSMFITFDQNDGSIKEYEYDFALSVGIISINFHYDLTFNKLGSGVSITPPEFSGVDLTPTAIDTTLETIKGELDEYKAQAVSSYDYDVQTAVDYSWNQLAVNSRSQGRTIQKKENDTTYFWNRLEFDSDYKNADQYDELITDYERYRANISTGEVYDVTDGFPSNTYDQVTPYDNANIDEYYFLLQNSFLTSDNISMVREVTTTAKTTYSLGLTNTGLLGFLTFVDDSIRMDVDLTDEHDIFNYEDNSLVLKSLKFNVEISDDKLSKIDIAIEGSYVDSIVEDEDGVNKTPAFNLDLVITPNEISEYDVPEDSGDIDLSNS